MLLVQFFFQAETMGKNPLYLMITVSLSVQFAFMLPVATAPNAVAFTTGKVRVVDLVCDVLRIQTTFFSVYLKLK